MRCCGVWSGVVAVERGLPLVGGSGASRQARRLDVNDREAVWVCFSEPVTLSPAMYRLGTERKVDALAIQV